MRVIYFGAIPTSEFDFPLLRAYQRLGLDVVAYFVLWNGVKESGLIDAKKIPPKDKIYKASDISAFQIYSDYLDLEKIYVINAFHHKRLQWQSWILWFKVLFHIIRQHTQIIHFAWPLSKGQKILYLFRCKRVLTVHDPIPHSSLANKYGEKCRRLAFAKCDRLVLLSHVLYDQFCKSYGVPAKKIIFNRLGSNECLNAFSGKNLNLNYKYVLFFGQIQKHKGVDVLLDAMKIVHEKYLDVKVIIAGKGVFSFNIEPFLKLDYVEIRNRYITVPELSQLLHGCLFAVCPYKDATQSGVVQTAFSANVPLIVTNVGDLPNAVKNEITGLVVPADDVNALGNAILRLIENPLLVLNFKSNIEKLWQPSMSWVPIAQKYIDCYKTLLLE